MKSLSFKEKSSDYERRDRNRRISAILLQILAPIALFVLFFYSLWGGDSDGMKLISAFLLMFLTFILGIKFVGYYLTGHKVANVAVISEFLLIFIGVPLLVMSATTIPVVTLLYILHINTPLMYLIATIILAIFTQVLIMAIIIKKVLKAKNLTLRQYFKYLLNSDYRTQISESVIKSRKPVGCFYEGLGRIEERMMKKHEEVSESSISFEGLIEKKE